MTTAILIIIEGHKTAFNGCWYQFTTGKPLKNLKLTLKYCENGSTSLTPRLSLFRIKKPSIFLWPNWYVCMYVCMYVVCVCVCVYIYIYIYNLVTANKRKKTYAEYAYDQINQGDRISL
jgi:hypothetical protein